jgi:hypothetical protein
MYWDRLPRMWCHSAWSSFPHFSVTGQHKGIYMCTFIDELLNNTCLEALMSAWNSYGTCRTEHVALPALSQPLIPSRVSGAFSE